MSKNMPHWIDPAVEMPPDWQDVLCYTDNNTMKVCCHGKLGWNTYTKVLAWMPLPDKPKIEVKKRNG